MNHRFGNDQLTRVQPRIFKTSTSRPITVQTGLETKMLFPLTTKDFLDRALEVYADRVAIIDEPDQPAASWGEITYTELGRRARSQAATLDEMGVPVGGRVAIVSQNSARFFCTLFGVSAWGRVTVPINYRLTATEIRYIVEHSDAEVLLIDPELR